MFECKWINWFRMRHRFDQLELFNIILYFILTIPNTYWSDNSSRTRFELDFAYVQFVTNECRDKNLRFGVWHLFFSLNGVTGVTAWKSNLQTQMYTDLGPERLPTLSPSSSWGRFFKGTWWIGLMSYCLLFIPHVFVSRSRSPPLKPWMHRPP